MIISNLYEAFNATGIVYKYFIIVEKKWGRCNFLRENKERKFVLL